MNFDDIGLDDLTHEDRVAFVLHAMEEAKLIIGSAMQMLSTGAIPENQAIGWQMLNLLVRQKEKELEKYLDDE
jgi:hypothetical protein